MRHNAIKRASDDSEMNRADTSDANKLHFVYHQHQQQRKKYAAIKKRDPWMKIRIQWHFVFCFVVN